LRIWPLRLLYTDAKVRAETEQAVRSIAESKGWIVSDIAIEYVHPDRLVLIHQLHVRGIDPRECLVYSFADSTLLPCER
jgi:hypothetical protein